MTTDKPWHQHLANQGARFGPGANSVEFDSPELGGVSLVPLVHLGALQVDGDDAGTLLHNLLSNDIKKLGPNRAQHSSLNSPKGRMLANFLLWAAADGFRLQLSADIAAAMAKKLSMYVLRSKAKVSDVSASRVTLGLLGASSALLNAAGLPAPEQAMALARNEDEQIDIVRLDEKRILLDAPIERARALWGALVAAGANPTGTNTWLREQIHAGIPLVTTSTQDEFVAQMLNFELLGGVDFKKGCYPGQEIVARTQYLGKLKKRMYLAHTEAGIIVSPAQDLYSTEFGEQSCGKVVNVAATADGSHDLLAVMQITAYESGDVRIGSPDGAKLIFPEQPYAID